MLKIRLQRVGRKGAPHYRIVVAENTSRATGKYIDLLGHFNPMSKELVLKKEQVLKWLDNGAQPTNRVAKLLVSQGVEHKLVKVLLRPERATKNPEKFGAAPAEAEGAIESTESEAPVESPAEEAAEEPTETKEE